MLVTSRFQLHMTVFNYLLSFLESLSAADGRGPKRVLAQIRCSSIDKVTEVQENEATCPEVVSCNVGNTLGPSQGSGGPSASPVVKQHFDNMSSDLASKPRAE